MKRSMQRMLLLTFCVLSATAGAAYAAEPSAGDEAATADYAIGTDDVLEISILQPEKLSTTVTVAPDGTITFPYIGKVRVKDETLAEVQESIQKKLADGYMKYPVVSVSLQQSRSRKFSVYGEVVKPGSYGLADATTALKAISIAGGFINYGSSCRIKVLRPKKDGTGSDTFEVDVKAAMNGISKADIMIQPDDTLMVSTEKYYVYGEVIRPGSFPLQENTTVMQAISIAGGFGKYGSSSRVKVLRTNVDGKGKETIKVNMRGAIGGASADDLILMPGDTVVVEEGMF